MKASLLRERGLKSYGWSRRDSTKEMKSTVFCKEPMLVSFKPLPASSFEILSLDETFGRRQSFGCDVISVRTLESKRLGSKMTDIVTGFYYFLRVTRVRNDGIIFRLHTLTTFVILMFSVIISSKQIVGNPIECIHTRDIPVEIFNSYCWIHSTYFVTGAMVGKTGVNVVAPGVGSSFGNLRSDLFHRKGNDGSLEQAFMKNVKYYQWVVFVLILQESENGKLAD